MNKVDEILIKELGYKKIETEDTVWYQKIEKENHTVKDIMFFLDTKKIAHNISYFDKSGNLLKKEGILSLKELEAIIEMTKELHWKENKKFETNRDIIRVQTEKSHLEGNEEEDAEQI